MLTTANFGYDGKGHHKINGDDQLCSGWAILPSPSPGHLAPANSVFPIFPMTIRPALPSDAAIIADFNCRLALETEGRELDPAVVKNGVLGLLGSPRRGIYFVAEIDGQIIGQILITYEWSDWRNGNFWWIQSVFVAADFRKQGVFRALYQHVKTAAEARPDVCGLRLYVEVENAHAQRAYELLGMKCTPYRLYEVEFDQNACRHHSP